MYGFANFSRNSAIAPPAVRLVVPLGPSECLSTAEPVGPSTKLTQSTLPLNLQLAIERDGVPAQRTWR